MTFLEFLVLLAMAAVVGILTQKMLGYKLGGLFVSIFLGFLGAYLGKELDTWVTLPINFDVHIGGRRFPVIWSFFGCLLVTFIVGFIARRASKHEKKKP
jgi:uncharacterized membrane protein YeaQ/YmgE (transglycosylase-associated protein family)